MLEKTKRDIASFENDFALFDRYLEVSAAEAAGDNDDEEEKKEEKVEGYGENDDDEYDDVKV